MQILNLEDWKVSLIKELLEDYRKGVQSGSIVGEMTVEDIDEVLEDLK